MSLSVRHATFLFRRTIPPFHELLVLQPAEPLQLLDPRAALCIRLAELLELHYKDRSHRLLVAEPRSVLLKQKSTVRCQ